MQGSGDKSRKTDTMQAVVQVGTIGFYPINSLSISAFHHGQCQVLIHSPLAPNQELVKQKGDLSVDGTTVPLQGNVFSSFSDAFYRGRLPELVVITCNMMETPQFLEAFLDFCEKLCTLGFLSPETDDDFSILDRYVPQVIIASYGIVFDVILDKMNTALSLISGISPRHRERILQKVSRGMWAFPEEGYDLTLTPLTLYPKPLALNVAGSSSIYTLRTTQLLETHGIPCEFNPNGSQGILEWEINLAYKHVLHRLLPLVNLGDASSLDINEHFESLAKAYDILPGQVTCLDNAGSKSKKSSPFKDYTLTTLDLAILHQLHQLAQGASLNSVAEFLDTLIHKIQPSVMTSTSA